MSCSSDDDEDSINGHSPEDDTNGSSSASASNESSSSNSKPEKFVRRESRDVVFLRIGVIFILLLAAAAVSVTVYFITENGEHVSFESHYEAAAEKVTSK
jgi:hypothetical protein